MVEPRNHIFITDLLRNREDLRDVRKFKEFKKFEIILKKLQELGVDIKNEVIVSDDIRAHPIDKQAKYIFIAGVSCGKKAGDYVHHLWCLTKTGVPIILVSDEEALCDFISLDFEESEQKIKKINFQCIKNRDFKNKECKVKTKYCENKKICEEYENLIKNLQILLRDFPEIQKTKIMPIFTYSFFVDFLLWQKLMGEDLFSKRFEFYRKELEDKENNFVAKGLAL